MLVCLPLLALVTGCGGDGLGTVPVTGTVTLDGQPVEGATVTFTPASETAGTDRSAVGLTDASGKYSLNATGGGEGAVPGTYSVTITKVEGHEAEAPAASQEEAMKKMQEQAAQGGSAALMPKPTVMKHLLPEKYSAPGTSGFKAEVKSGSNVFDFPLTSGG
jgi:hypothetical protein